MTLIPRTSLRVDDISCTYQSRREVRLDGLIGGIGDRLRYTYDFGDDREHEIPVEGLLDADPELHYPGGAWCLASASVSSDQGDPISSRSMVRTIIQLSEDQAAALERAAHRRGVSKAAVVREALGMLLARESSDPAVERAMRAAGAGASGLNDLGERHDDYLAEPSRA